MIASTTSIPDQINLPSWGFEGYQKDCLCASRICGGREQEMVKLINEISLLWFRWNKKVPEGQSWHSNLNNEEIGIINYFKSRYNPKLIESCINDQSFVRTLLMINVAKERNFVRRVRKWNGPLFNNYSFHAFTDSKTPQIVVLIERIYKGRNGKKVHVGLDLNQEKPIAVTVMPESLPAIVELSFPSWNVWEQCEDLVPPFTKIYPVSKRKGGVKLVALGCLFQTDAQKMDSTLNNVLKALVAATKAEIYLQQILKVSHSDIKPANIFISAEGKFQLGDFGHVTVLGNPTRGGTFGFKAPEDTITRIKGAFSAIWEIGMTGIELMNSSIRIKFLRSKHHYSTFSQDFLNQFINFQQKEAEKRYKNCKESILWHDLFDLCAECLRMNPEERPSLFKILKGFEQLQCEDHQKRRISEEEKQRSFKRFTKMLVKASQEDPI